MALRRADSAGMVWPRPGALEKLVEQLYERRTKIRDLVTAFRDSARNPFPSWREPTVTAISDRALALSSAI